MYLLKVISYIGLLFLFFNIILSFIGFAAKSKTYKFFSVYLLVIFIIQIVAELYAEKGYNNHFLSTYLLFLQFILLSCFCSGLFKNVNPRLSKSINYIAIIVTAGMLAQYIISPSLYYSINTLGLLITLLLIVIYAVVYLFEHMSKKLPYFYITVGLLVYFISSAVIFASAAAIIQFGKNINLVVWSINGMLFIVFQLLILLEWIQTFFRKRSPQ